jgi:hypothetical protein
MVKAALFSVALHGVLVLALRRDRTTPPSHAMVEMVVVSHPATPAMLHESHGGSGVAMHRTNGARRTFAVKASTKETAPTAETAPAAVMPQRKLDLFAPSALAAGMKRRGEGAARASAAGRT